MREINKLKDKEKENKASYLDHTNQNIIKIIGVFDNIDINHYIEDNTISPRQKQKLGHIKKLLNYPDLSTLTDNPIKKVLNKIINSEYFSEFDKIIIPEIVSEHDTFDLFDYDKNHPARKTSDTYFINKTDNTESNIMLRPHMSVMWHYYLNHFIGKEKLKEKGEISSLSRGKVYRLDYVDKTHHECFHQIDGLKIIDKSKTIITNENIKDILINIISIIMGDNIEWRIVEKSFPFIDNGLELEVKIHDKRVRSIGAGIIKENVLANLGIDIQKYNGFAFGFSVERLIMAIKKVPDIRYFWNTEKRITDQWKKDLFHEFVHKELLPSYQTKSISMIVPKEIGIENKILQELNQIMISENISNSHITDIFENDKKFGLNKQSITITFNINTLEKDKDSSQINKIYFKIREEIVKKLGYDLR